MCQNKRALKIDDYFILGYRSAQRLESFWSRHGYAGIGAIFTSFGPYFFDMAELRPIDVVRDLKEQFDVSWGTVAEWCDALEFDSLH